MYHVPMCLTCGKAEVVGKYSNDDGTGFCSSLCKEVAVMLEA